MQTSNLPICAIRTTMMTKNRSTKALATSDDPAARAYLEPYLYGENTETRLAAIDALGTQGETQPQHRLWPDYSAVRILLSEIAH